MRVLVCGGRDFGDISQLKNKATSLYKLRKQEYDFIIETLDQFARENSKFYRADQENWLPYDIEIISGAARGVDSVAAQWAKVKYCKLREFPADWDQFKQNAGWIRNKQMLEEGNPDLVLAFPGGKGTKDMKKQAQREGVQVIEVRYHGLNTEEIGG